MGLILKGHKRTAKTFPYRINDMTASGCHAINHTLSRIDGAHLIDASVAHIRNTNYSKINT